MTTADTPATRADRAAPDDVERFLALLARPGDVFELRAVSKRRKTQHAGFFDDMTALARAAVERSVRGHDDGIYVTINPVHDGLLARYAANQVHEAQLGTSSDKDVVARRHMLVDVDPVRPSGISSTDTEHTAAITLVTSIAAALRELGWPEPLIGDSGNGGHLVYAIDLPRDDGWLVKRVLARVAELYSSATCKVDTEVWNPSRISKIYGTLARKGRNDPKRPHRVSKIITAPSELVVVTREQLEAFVPATPPTTSKRQTPPGPSSNSRRFDLEAFIAEHLPDAQQKPWDGGEGGKRKWILPTCPYDAAHNRGEAFIVEMTTGAWAAGCLNTACTWDEHDLRERFEPGHRERRNEHVPNGHQRTSHPPPDNDAPAPEPTVDRDHPRLTEIGNAQRFARMHGHRLRYVQTWGKWLVWDGRRWKPDELGAEMTATKAVAESIYADAANLAQRAATGDERAGSLAEAMTKWGKASSKASALRAMLLLAQSEDLITAAAGEFDRDRFELNVQNGTLDLRTGELRPHRQMDMITKLAPASYDPSTTCPQWDAFLSRVLPDGEVRAFVQRFIGYALTGAVTEQMLMFAYGSGANGKSVLLDVILAILGDYGLRAAPDLVLAKKGESHPTELAELEGRRLVVCSEIDPGRAWGESTIKRITGDTTITARRMRQDFYTFPATHKLVIAANTRPIVRGTDQGIWRRMRLVPFGVTIPPEERDKGLVARLLEEERPGILAWAVRGCLAWQRDGIGESAAVTEATESYRIEQDILGIWIAEECVLLPDAFAATTALYDNYVTWCQRTRRETWTRDTMRARLLERPGLTDRRTTVARGVAGIGLVHRGGSEAKA